MAFNVNKSLAKAKVEQKNGDMATAEQLYRDVLSNFPKNKRAIQGLKQIRAVHAASRVHNNDPTEAQLAHVVALYNKGQLQSVIEQAGILLHKFPNSVTIHNIIGVASANLQDFHRACACYRKALSLNPDFVEGYYNLGLALQASGDLDGAVSSFKNAVKRKPDYADAYHNIGILCSQKGNQEAAAESFQKAIEIDPNHSSAFNNLAILLLQRQAFEPALQCAAKALEIDPEFAEAHKTVGDIYFQKRNLKLAIERYTKALQIDPAALPIHNNLAAARLAHGDRVGAIESYSNLLRLAPEQQEPRAKKLFQMANLCDWSEFDKNVVAGLGVAEQEIAPFSMLSLEDAPDRHLIRAKTHARLGYNTTPLPLPARPERRPDRLKIGYFSADVHQHPVMMQLAQVLEMHDRSRFEIFLYGFSPRASDAVRDRMIGAVDIYDDVLAMPDRDVALLARQDKIDIAIDLNGYTENSRSDIFSYRAAPIQISFLGYPGTMGADFIDYIVADKNLIPVDYQRYYSEKPIYLPHQYQSQDNSLPISETVPARAELGLPEKAFVFCSFSNSYKITPVEFDIWMRLLQAVEGSVLWLLKSNKWVVENLCAEAAKRGVNPARLIFAEHTAHESYLAQFKQADLYLDTFVYNAGATASNALWAGLPVLTKPGCGYAARMAASLLRAIDLPELITNSAAGYEALALALAQNPERLSKLKAKLAKNRLSAPLFDTPLFTKNLEDGYLQAYKLYFDGYEPAVIEVV